MKMILSYNAKVTSHFSKPRVTIEKYSNFSLLCQVIQNIITVSYRLSRFSVFPQNEIFTIAKSIRTQLYSP